METTVLTHQIQKTSEGFMALDVPKDEYLHDEDGNNCFDTIEEAQALIVKALKKD